MVLFVLSKKGENCILFSPMNCLETLCPGMQVARNSTPYQKGAKFGVQKVNEGRDIYIREYRFGNGKHCQIHAQHFKG